MTKQTILERLIDQALEEDEPILLRPPKYPLSDRLRRNLREYPWDWGVVTSERDIDRILYEGGG